MNKLVTSFVVLLTALVGYSEALNVSVYYEARCRDSVNFIVDKLYPFYAEISHYIDLEFIPYGKALHSKTNDTWHFTCQHGPSECRGNKYQSCVLSQQNGQDKDVEFVNCIMRYGDPSLFRNVETEYLDGATPNFCHYLPINNERYVQTNYPRNAVDKIERWCIFSVIRRLECASRLNLDINRIRKCARTEEGNNLLAKNGDKTWNLDPSISFVPTIIYDNKYDDQSQWQSIKDFVAVVCHKIDGDKPRICENKVLPDTGLAWWG